MNLLKSKTIHPKRNAVGIEHKSSLNTLNVGDLKAKVKLVEGGNLLDWLKSNGKFHSY